MTRKNQERFVFFVWLALITVLGMSIIFSSVGMKNSDAITVRNLQGYYYTQTPVRPLPYVDAGVVTVRKEKTRISFNALVIPYHQIPIGSAVTVRIISYAAQTPTHDFIDIFIINQSKIRIPVPRRPYKNKVVAVK